MGQEIKCPKKWVVDRLREHRFVYDYKTDALKFGSSLVEESLALAILKIDARQNDAAELKSYIRDALLIYRHERAQQELAKLIGQLNCTDARRDLVETWVRAVTGRNSSLDIAVMRHFIWQVKRKLKQLPVEHHMMPILFGKSGGGKSVAVSKLTEPLKMVTLHASMTIFADQFSRRAFARNFIIFFDELNGSAEADVNSMKQVITASVIEWRQMRSERVMSAPQNATFIGCSNDTVRDRINDPTSARRFWQVNCADQIDWETINSIDYDALWTSVDETVQSPIHECLEEIKVIQEKEIRYKDVVEQWFEDCCEVVGFDNSSLTSSELYESFKQYCEWQGMRIFPQFQKFARDLKRVLEVSGHGAASKKTNRGTTWAIRVKTCEAVSVNGDGSDVQLAFDFRAA